MKEKILNFYKGRYGTDKFNNFLLGLTVVFLILRIIIKSDIIYILALAIIIFANYRSLSKNIGKRQMENQKYMKIYMSFLGGISSLFLNVFGSKQYKYFKCENCKSQLRVPRRKGKIKVTCPKCKSVYIKRT